jgi:hypothetical protein
MYLPTEKAVQELRRIIATAWLVNAEEVWPTGAIDPNPVAMANLASQAAWNYFMDLIETEKEELKAKTEESDGIQGA